MEIPRRPVEDRPQLPLPEPPEPPEREESSADSPQRGVITIPILEPEESPQ